MLPDRIISFTSHSSLFRNIQSRGFKVETDLMEMLPTFNCFVSVQKLKPTLNKIGLFALSDRIEFKRRYFKSWLE